MRNVRPALWFDAVLLAVFVAVTVALARRTPVLAVDLPGRGTHPAAPGTVDFAACAATVTADIDEAGFADVVLVGHSLAGCSMPAPSTS